ncbi:MAG: hypothetical protein JWR69_4642 [Pedosphaera sp.]|nr:hypothetical protein [Pedosphaera sp.]
MWNRRAKFQSGFLPSNGTGATQLSCNHAPVGRAYARASYGTESRPARETAERGSLHPFHTRPFRSAWTKSKPMALTVHGKSPPPHGVRRQSGKKTENLKPNASPNSSFKLCHSTFQAPWGCTAVTSVTTFASNHLPGMRSVALPVTTRHKCLPSPLSSLITFKSDKLKILPSPTWICLDSAPWPCGKKQSRAEN